ncbi:MAG: NHLP leader peptide family RiPP precursor [Bacteroidota bacterium]
MELTKNQKIIAQLLEKSWDDPNFRQNLIEKPEATIQQATGASLDIPEGRTLKVVDQTDDSYVYLNLPPRPDMDEVELTDTQLELIAGGASDAEIVAAQNSGGGI